MSEPEPKEPKEPIEPVEPIEDELEPTPEPKQRSKGFKTEEQWEAEGNDSADYVSKEVWEAKRGWLKSGGKQKRKIENLEHQIANMQADFDQRLENQNKLSAIGLESQKDALQAQLEESIERGDKDEALSIQGNIDKLNPVIDNLNEPAPKPQPTAPQKAPEQQEWEDNNAWIWGKSAKANHAKAMFNEIKRDADSWEDLFTKLDAEILREFPTPNPNRNKPRAAEGGSPSGKPKAAGLTERDFTAEEKSYVKNFGWEVAPDGKGGVDMKKMTAMIEKSRA